MNGILKLHGNPTGALFIIASTALQYALQNRSESASNVFKLVYSQMENFHGYAKFFSNYNKFWVITTYKILTTSFNH